MHKTRTRAHGMETQRMRVAEQDALPVLQEESKTGEWKSKSIPRIQSNSSDAQMQVFTSSSLFLLVFLLINSCNRTSPK